MITLDVGCGNRPLHESSQDSFTIIHVDKDPVRLLGLFVVVADAHMLPFRRGIFWRIYASHVLEHCLVPLRVLLEFGQAITRRGYVEVRIPDKVYQVHEQFDHFYTWTASTIGNLMSMVFDDVHVTSNFRVFGHDVLELLKLEGVIRYFRLITKSEIVAIGRSFNGK